MPLYSPDREDQQQARVEQVSSLSPEGSKDVGALRDPVRAGAGGRRN